MPGTEEYNYIFITHNVDPRPRDSRSYEHGNRPYTYHGNTTPMAPVYPHSYSYAGRL